MSPNPVRTAALALGFALSAALALASPVAATADSGPQLSIAIDDGEESAGAGDTLTYAVTIDNLGTSRVKKLRVSMSMPDGLELVSADHEGAERKAGVVWSVDLAPGGRATLHTTLEVGRTPVDLLRLATVACAALPPATSPVVCASDSDELAAGAAARVASAAGGEDRKSDTGAQGMSTPQAVGLAALLLMLAAGLGAFTLWSRGAHAVPR
jgi:uncharacterized repeat protein (TIGR01451 family)